MIAEPLVELSDFELSIECDHEDCPYTAVVAVKGCADSAAWLICRLHFNLLSDEVSQVIADGPVICGGCYRPVLYFVTHYEVVWL